MSVQSMSSPSAESRAQESQAQESWVPMIAIALGQMIMFFNVASLPVALGGMVRSFDVPPTTIATGIVAYSILVAGFVMLGAVRVNTDSRLRALKIGLLIMAGLALITIIPAGRLPNYVPGEVPDDQPPSKAAGKA